MNPLLFLNLWLVNWNLFEKINFSIQVLVEKQMTNYCGNIAYFRPEGQSGSQFNCMIVDQRGFTINKQIIGLFMSNLLTAKLFILT